VRGKVVLHLACEHNAAQRNVRQRPAYVNKRFAHAHPGPESEPPSRLVSLRSTNYCTFPIDCSTISKRDPKARLRHCSMLRLDIKLCDEKLELTIHSSVNDFVAFTNGPSVTLKGSILLQKLLWGVTSRRICSARPCGRDA
jgi:hypothetical protein